MQFFHFRKTLALRQILLTMKLLAAIMFLGLMQVSAHSNGQRVSISGKNISLQKVFKEIRKQAGYVFFYDVDLIKKAQPITINAINEPVETVLTETFQGQPFTWSVENKTITVISKLRSQSFLDSLDKESGLFQEVVVRGVVLDDTGKPLEGVSVLIKGTQRGTSTDKNGSYYLSGIGENAVLVFSMVGYNSQEVSVKGRSVINVKLSLNLKQQEEITVVNTGYQTISKERATGAFGMVSSDQLGKPSSNIAERLVGTVAGLQTTVAPDGSIKFQIRGQSSLFSDQQPLVVYDGFAVEGGMESIDPNDVESITILKDAAAASIWGAKSANGVIVITSKNARKGSAIVGVSSFVRFSPKLNLDYVNPLATSAQTIDYEQKGFNSDFFGGPWTPPSASISDLGAYSLAVTAMNEARLGRISGAERDKILAQLSTLNNKQQIKDYLLQAPLTTHYNLSISGGNDRMTNRVSIMFDDNKSFFKGDKKGNLIIDYSNEVNLTKRLKFDLGSMVQLENSQSAGVNLGEIQSLSPYDMLVNNDGNLIDMSYLYYYKPNFNAFVPKEKFPYSDWSYNPISEMKYKNFSAKSLNGRFRAGLTLNPIEGLVLSSRIQYETYNTTNRNYYDPRSFAIRQFVNETSSWNQDFNSIPVQNVPTGGVLSQNKTELSTYNFRNQLTFNRRFAQIHNISFVAGSEMSSRVSKFTRYPDALGYNDNTLTTGELLHPISGSSMWNGYPLSYAAYFYPFNIRPVHAFSYTTDRYFSFYGNLAYTFNNKYTVSGSYRTDASNLISEDPKYRYSPFWSTGFSWQAGREKFFQAIKWLDRLNIRGTYGYNGNVDKSTSFLPLINVTGTLDPYIHETIGTISSYGNPTLRWERTNTINLGLDFSIFDGKLFGSLDLYDKRSSDLIVTQSIPSVNGTSSQKFNNGKMMNRGFELSLGTLIPIRGNEIEWKGSLNYSYNKNKITKFYKSSYQMYDLYSGGTTSYVEGYNANTLWSLRYAGMNNVGTDTNPQWEPTFYGLNGAKLTFLAWPVGNATGYESNEGTTVAPSIFGFTSSIKVYQFDFSFIITGKFGHVFRRQSFNYPSMTGGNTLVNAQYGEILTSDPSKRVPIPSIEPRYYFWDRFYPYLDYLTQNASHIRLQEVNLTYSLPANLLSKVGMKSVRVFAQANDCGVILFNDFGEDPEYPKGTLKPQAKYTFGINFNF